MGTIKSCIKNVFSFRSKKANQNQEDQKSRKIREDLSEKQVDKMVEDSFPASDPPSTY